VQSSLEITDQDDIAAAATARVSASCLPSRDQEKHTEGDEFNC
jgi:hypothetical protein